MEAAGSEKDIDVPPLVAILSVFCEVHGPSILAATTAADDLPESLQFLQDRFDEDDEVLMEEKTAMETLAFLNEDGEAPKTVVADMEEKQTSVVSSSTKVGESAAGRRRLKGMWKNPSASGSRSHQAGGSR